MLDNVCYSGGFLKLFNAELRNSVDETVFRKFSLLQTDEERFSFVYSLPAAHSCNVNLSENLKNAEHGNILKEDGNKAFQSGDYHKALQLYNKAAQKLPWSGELPGELAVAVANRSAALYHLKQYQQAQDDIALALSLGYPPHLHHKVLESMRIMKTEVSGHFVQRLVLTGGDSLFHGIHFLKNTSPSDDVDPLPERSLHQHVAAESRRARCLLATNQLKDALEAFKQTLSCLDAAVKMAADKRMKTQKDMQIMIAILLKNKILENASLPSRGVTPATSGEASRMYLAASSAVTVEQRQEMGRFAVASRDIAPGETVVVESPHCAVLLAEYSHDHCSHCFKKLVSLVPCPCCCNVGFCSTSCREEALSSYHGVECPVLEALWASGASVTALMALRILSQRPATHFLHARTLLQQVDAGTSPRTVYQGSDYETVYQLVRHHDRRTPEDFFQRTAMAVFLFRCLCRGGYFGCDHGGSGRELTEDERLVGGLLLRHLQLLQFNAHEVSELQVAARASPHSGKSTFIGGGLYPTLALFNHSCEPSVVRYFVGACVVVRTVKTIRAGEMIAENYGPIFTQVRREARRATLREQYWFECECLPCKEDWPLFEELDPGVMRFRCTAGAGSPCRAVVPVPVDTADLLVCCPSCGGHTNIMKGLKTLQDTDAMFQAASRLMEAGNVVAALPKFLQVLCVLDKTLVPPFLDYHLCQQAVRRCMLSLGNICTGHA